MRNFYLSLGVQHCSTFWLTFLLHVVKIPLIHPLPCLGGKRTTFLFFLQFPWGLLVLLFSSKAQIILLKLNFQKLLEVLNHDIMVYKVLMLRCQFPHPPPECHYNCLSVLSHLFPQLANSVYSATDFFSDSPSSSILFVENIPKLPLHLFTRRVLCKLFLLAFGLRFI